MLNIEYRLIKRYYYEFVESLELGNLEVQNMNRRLLNNTIKSYVANGGKRNIEKYCKYYV